VADFTVDESVGTADFVITYTGPTVADAFTVDFVVSDGTAIDPDDYSVATVGTSVTFPAGTVNGATQVVTINIVDDTIIEGPEDLNITLSNISNPGIAMVDADGIGTITDNDGSGPGEGISVADFTVDESVGTADFVITYTGPTVADAFTVDFVVSDGTAIDPDDYSVATVGTSVTFPAGTVDGATQVVTINIVDDAIIEGPEDLNITLSNISNPGIAMVDADGIGTITDNDGSGPGEGISVADFTVDEEWAPLTLSSPIQVRPWQMPLPWTLWSPMAPPLTRTITPWPPWALPSPSRRAPSMGPPRSSPSTSWTMPLSKVQRI
jgi:hypothetical protein